MVYLCKDQTMPPTSSRTCPILARDPPFQIARSPRDVFISRKERIRKDTLPLPIKVLRAPRTSQKILRYGCGSKLNHQNPQALVHMPIYQSSIWVPIFDPQPYCPLVRALWALKSSLRLPATRQKPMNTSRQVRRGVH